MTEILLGQLQDEASIRSRVRGWMTLESQGLDFWICTNAPNGKLIFCSSNDDRYAPNQVKTSYAAEVMRHLNITSNHGGVWLVGWIGAQFYMLWKDADGDIQIPIECNKPWIVLREWKPCDWERHAEGAHEVWSEIHKNMEYAPSQLKKVAQGEQLH